MGFPSPARDYVEKGISLDNELISHPSATYYVRSEVTHWRAGIKRGALLVVDSSLNPCDGSIVLCDIDGEFVLRYYRQYPERCLESLDNGKKDMVRYIEDGASIDVFGVVTFIINDARSGEFDDYPLK
ncbi:MULTISPECIES: S24 family peptidase [Escherichia]|uniref:HumD family translesion DNA polymerase n=1 Tax=Escherichia TaxID=561 RepID=UPI0011CD8418|nr:MULTISPECIES: S24 family peptidase [Escherichia]EFH4910753.1 hypothetical protein [Escherichia coli]EFL4511996.1 hypothetical protein [Escherichia fergusonii]EFL4516545.1 hypothetical protein [Escherichia fergusonii]EGI6835331.1 hypothetical protein [Escherichia coli]EIT7523888.1 hypothetical protein [Escherichia coli]